MKNRKHRIVRVTGGRVAVMNTSRIPDRDLDRALRWLAREVDLDRVIVHAKSLGKNRRTLGYAYRRVPAMANVNGLRRYEWRNLIVITDTASWFNVLAHEAKHIEQFRDRTMVSERRANAWAAGIEEKYLKSQTAPAGAA